MEEETYRVILPDGSAFVQLRTGRTYFPLATAITLATVYNGYVEIPEDE